MPCLHVHERLRGAGVSALASLAGIVPDSETTELISWGKNLIRAMG